jgi:hypothetical protein
MHVGEPGARPQPPPGRVAWLPPRAARARKLILRTRLGLPWILAALAFAALILVAGGVLLVRSGRPADPWVRLGPVAAFPAGQVSQAPAPDGRALVVDRRDAGLRVFLAEPGPCPVQAAGAGFARPCQGRRWDGEGRPAGAGPALRRVPVQLAHGDLYVDPAAG